MKLLADENIPYDISSWLRAMGHDVLVAVEIHPGAADSDWVVRAEQEQRLILTSDKDYGELIFRDRLTSQGVVLLRMDDILPAEMLARLQVVWSVVEANPQGQFIVITPTRIRVRPLPPSPPATDGE
ncbi:DUF5615 family PIN-like protein [Anatilimnocola sp. NA78]|uniref:DUF5615 family PIN-like protein n=1 Tax=Anatilimnocola sp. NA78 TaxID=3415683 RepID=UPI003CE59EA0